MPVFSIVVPIYNVQKYLQGCIDSVLRQTFQDLELILVDDGSPDGSPAICDKAAELDRRVRVIHQANGGAVAAREAGVAAASGDYLIFLDGDDWLPLKTLRHYGDIIEKYDPDLISAAYNIGSEGNLQYHRSAFHHGFYDRKMLIKEIFPSLIESENGSIFAPSLWAKAYRLKKFRTSQSPLDHAVRIAEDHAITRPYIYRCRSAYLTDEAMYNYRVNEDSTTQKPSSFSWDGPRLVTEHFEWNIPMDEENFQDQVYRSTVHNVFNVAVSRFNQEKTYREVRSEILENIQKPCYSEAILNCRYAGNWRGSMAQFCLRRRVIFPMFLFWKLRNRK